MAEAVAEGAKNGKVEVKLCRYLEPEELGKYDAILVGTPTYDHNIPMDIKRLFEEAAVKGVSLKGRVGAVFGSYGWSGEAPKLMHEIMRHKFEMNLIESPLLAKFVFGDQTTLNNCKNLGKRVSESLTS